MYTTASVSGQSLGRVIDALFGLVSHCAMDGLTDSDLLGFGGHLVSLITTALSLKVPFTHCLPLLDLDQTIDFVDSL